MPIIAKGTPEFFKGQTPRMPGISISTPSAPSIDRPTAGAELGLKISAGAVKGLRELGIKIKAAQAESELFNAMADWAKVSSEIEQTARNETPDYRDLPKVIEKRLREAQQHIGKQVTVKDAYDLYARQVLSDTTRIQQRTGTYVQSRIIDEARSRLNVNLFERLQAIHRNPAAAAENLAWMDGEIDSKIRTGIITAQEGEKTKLKMRQEIDAVKADTLLLGSTVDTISGISEMIMNPELFPHLSEPQRLKYFEKAYQQASTLLQEQRQQRAEADRVMKARRTKLHEDTDRQMWLLAEQGKLTPSMIRNALASDSITRTMAEFYDNKLEKDAKAGGAEKVKDDPDIVAHLNNLVARKIFVPSDMLKSYKDGLSDKTYSNFAKAFASVDYDKGRDYMNRALGENIGDKYDPKRGEIRSKAWDQFHNLIAKGTSPLKAAKEISSFYLQGMYDSLKEDSARAFTQIPMPDAWQSEYRKLDPKSLLKMREEIKTKFETGFYGDPNEEEAAKELRRQLKIIDDLEYWRQKMESTNNQMIDNERLRKMEEADKR